MILKHIVESQQFTVPLLMELFERTRQMEKIVARGGTRDYEHKILATLFYRPSTRTRFSFEAAMLRLGGKVLSTEQAGAFSSVVPGERLEDTIRVTANNCDAIVLRHNEEGAAARAAGVSSVPIINAGEGPGGQHPTQALLDLYTIYNECKTLDGLSVALVGALGKSRTGRSLTYLLGKFARVRMFFVAPPQMQISPDILAYLDRHNVRYELADSPEDVLPQVDVVYQKPIDRTRVHDGDINLATYNIGVESLARMKQNAIVMHALPRGAEIDPLVDHDPRAAYFRQSRNGLFVRMALLTMLFEEE
jgi:aspartate carbamoyltransferase catalytic subunit